MFGLLAKFFLGWKPSHIVSKWTHVWQRNWFHLKKCLFHQQIAVSWFLGVLSVHFKPLSLSLKWVTILVAATWRVGSPAKLPTWWRQRGQRGYQLFLSLDWILFCTIHIKELKLSWKSRNRSKMFQVTLSKALAEFC